MSSLVAPNSMASAASAIIVPATEAMIQTPSTRSDLASAIDLDEAVGLAVGLGAAVRHHRELADLDLVARRLGILLGEADPGDLGHGVDDARDHLVIDDADLAGEDLGDRDPLILGLVGEHRPRRDVADRVDAGDRGPEIVIDLDLAALVASRARPWRDRARRCSAAGRSRPGRRPPRSSRRRRRRRARR